MSDEEKPDFFETAKHQVEKALNILTEFDGYEVPPPPEIRVAKATRTLSYLSALIHEEARRQQPPVSDAHHGSGYVGDPTVAFPGADAEAIVGNLKPLRIGGIHLDAPAGSVITVTLPKE